VFPKAALANAIKPAAGGKPEPVAYLASTENTRIDEGKANLNLDFRATASGQERASDPGNSN
jgi:hypothetical protein